MLVSRVEVYHRLKIALAQLCSLCVLLGFHLGLQAHLNLCPHGLLLYYFQVHNGRNAGSGGRGGRSSLLPLLAVDWDGDASEGAEEVLMRIPASARGADFGGRRCGSALGWAGGMVEGAGETLMLVAALGAGDLVGGVWRDLWILVMRDLPIQHCQTSHPAESPSTSNYTHIER